MFIVLFILIGLNAFFVGTEIALLSARKTKLNEMTNKSIFRTMLIDPIVNNLDLFITATQFGSTTVSIGIGWIGQSLFANLTHRYLSTIGKTIPILTSPLFTSIIPFIFITFVIMILGELLPKKIMMRNPEGFAIFFAIPLLIYAKIFSPLLHFINNLTDKIIGIFGDKNIKEPSPFSENELKIIIEQSVKDGVIPESLRIIIFNTLKLKQISTKLITIPNSKLYCFNSDDTLDEIKNAINQKNLVFNRYPIIHKNLSKPYGNIEIHDFFKAVNKYPPNTKLNRTGIIRNSIIIDEDLTADYIFQSMLNKKIYTAVVYNKKRKKSIGIITIGDIARLLTKP